MKKAEIRFVRKYKVFNDEMVDTIYKSGMVVTRGADDLPETVKDFIRHAPIVKTQWDMVFNREETYFGY